MTPNSFIPLNVEESAIEALLHEHGVFVSTIRGVSMKPLLRQGIDAVQIESIDSASADPAISSQLKVPLRPYDVILYRVPDTRRGGTKLLLHRIVGIKDCEYLVLGDNTVVLEHVHPHQVLGKMTAFWRGQNHKRIELDSFAYKLYVTCWCRPWRLRTPLLKARLAIKRALGKMPSD